MANHWFGVMLATFWLIFSLPPAQAQTAADQALTVYNEGKKLYDAADYAGARSKFIKAIRIEPENARWHYNLGLTHRQMGNDQAARQSLLRARELNPDYKRAEIDQKLSSMGFAPGSVSPGDRAEVGAPGAPAIPPPEESDDVAFVLWLVGGIFAFVIGFIALVFWLIRRSAKSSATTMVSKESKASRSKEAPPDASAVAALDQRLQGAGQSLTQVEHALRCGEHADLRSQLDHATQLEHGLRENLAAARAGDGHAYRKAVRAMSELDASANKAVELATQTFGAPALAGQGEKIACYFCARPLANSDYRRLVALKRGDSRADVVSCPNCAKVSAQGEAPPILTSADGKTHWSEIPSFDPYAARHSAASTMQRVPAWRFAPQRSFGELALLAGGAALAGGAVAAMLRSGQAPTSEPLLDLDAARESGLAQEAARATAKRASEQRRDSLSDHS